MICVLQRVIQSSVTVDAQIIGQINQGLMVLCAFERNDELPQLQKMADKLLKYRCFSDENDKMNLNVQQVKGGLLLVPQFTLAADTQSGLRPSFSTCKPPEEAANLFEKFCLICRQSYDQIQQGKFGANMQVALINDGPVTFKLKT